MLFSSVIFLFYFFPVVLGLYYLCSFSRRLQNALLLISSLIFYGWGEKMYTLLLLASIAANSVFGILIDKLGSHRTAKKAALLFACLFNLGILFYFKYLNFTVGNLNALFGLTLSVGQVVLPLGISFFTFQALSYVVDVYRGTVPVQKNPFYVGLYIAFFPQLIAGPIVQYSTIADQILNRTHTMRKFSVGCCRFVTGLGKKVIIANSVAIVADRVYALLGTDQTAVSAAVAWLGSIAYTLQIYFDFSAYSDMAIGLGLMFGFRFKENFDYPYISNSVTEFWRRWHISLTTWFRNYIYFPLGGSRVENSDKMVRNMLVVWICTGVWHGANWTFILWGLLNFCAIIAERFFRLDRMEDHVAGRRILTLLLVNFGWVLFRSADLNQAGQYFMNMLCLGGNQLIDAHFFMFLREYGVFFLLGIVFSAPIARRFNRILVDGGAGRFEHVMNAGYPLALLAVLLICTAYLVKGTYNPFIYFNF